MSNIKISIITATLNSVNNLESLIKSIIPQISKEVEYIIIDGGSTDGTIEIIKKYSKYLRYWSSFADSGIYDALNKGIKHASGEYVSFVGSDDILKSNYMDVYLSAIKKNPQVSFFSSKALVNNKEVGKKFNSRDLEIGMAAVHPGSLHKKELLDHCGGFNTQLKIASDYEFLVKFRSLLDFYFIDRVTITLGDKGVSNTNYMLAIKEVYSVQQEYNLNNFIINKIIFLQSFIKKILKNIYKC